MHFLDLTEKVPRVKKDFHPLLRGNLAGIDEDPAFGKRAGYAVAALENGERARSPQPRVYKPMFSSFQINYFIK